MEVLVYRNLGSFPGRQAWTVEMVHLMDVHANIYPVTSALFYLSLSLFFAIAFFLGKLET